MATVFPAQAGIQNGTASDKPAYVRHFWIPAYAGMMVGGGGKGGGWVAARLTIPAANPDQQKIGGGVF